MHILLVYWYVQDDLHLQYDWYAGRMHLDDAGDAMTNNPNPFELLHLIDEKSASMLKTPS